MNYSYINCILNGNSNTEILSAFLLKTMDSCVILRESASFSFELYASLSTLVLILDPSSSFLKPLLTCGIISQGAEGVIASLEHSHIGGNSQAFFMAVYESDEC